MLDKNCCLPQSTVSVTAKHAGIKLFQTTTRKDYFHLKWRKATMDTISQFRIYDSKLRNHASVEKF